VTEISELPPEVAAMLMQQQGGVPNPAFEKAQDAFHEAVHRFEREAYAAVQFWSPVICACERLYDWGDPSPPQQGCVVHGYVMTDRHSGAIFLFGIPKAW
jgi:hypothetical protein